jgi:glycosyltransferase involved in cell wall biosynthesis
MTTPRVSVVIPTYNRADYVVQAIDSVLEQSLQGSEIIVVDDGSTDDTEARMRAFGDRVVYVKTQNGGSGHARNVGMLRATGEYIAYLDSDDLYNPYKLELQMRVLDRFPDVGMVYSEVSGFQDDRVIEEYHLQKYHSSAFRNPRLTYDRIFSRSMTIGEAGVLPDGLAREKPALAARRAYFGRIFDVYLLNLVVFTNSIMMRRSVVPVVGLRDESVTFWEEMEFALRICRTQQVCFLDVPTYKLRYHPGQLSTTHRVDGNYIWIRKQQSLLRVIKRHSLADPVYYASHRARIDRHLARLHRAVAVPLMIFPGPSSRNRNYVRRARRYLAGCRRYGRREAALSVISYMPGPLRHVATAALERMRTYWVSTRGRAV